MNKKQAKEVTKYIIDTLNYLDGRGIVFEDEKLAKETLSGSERAKYEVLEGIIKGTE
jgi:hypothetical protein